MNYNWKIKLFAGLQERLGSRELLLTLSEEIVSAAELKEQIISLFPEQAALVRVSFVARNHSYAPDEQPLHVNDDLALLPPVSGGEERSRDQINTEQQLYTVTEEPIVSDEVLNKIISPKHGASIVFVGTTREWTNGQQTVRLEYEAYEPMAVATMRQIGNEINERWPGALCAISHRVGVVELAEISVVIAVSAPHREGCYEASRYAIERLKQIVPIWKKEVWADGSQWMGHQQGPWNPTESITD
ncbi:molybdenum cofactor biosynthesis protein MoaE [Paenibacillus sp. GCM10027627]|uniref:molybdenum cofactor biosynthesis protein n=1 Tax=unclassified Paenibacillus TaxID=185978 RepID=UPI00362ECB18